MKPVTFSRVIWLTWLCAWTNSDHTFTDHMLQRNLSNPVAFGPKIFGLTTEVAAIPITSLEWSLRKIVKLARLYGAHHL